MEPRRCPASYLAVAAVAIGLVVAPSSASADDGDEAHRAPISTKARKHLELGLTQYQAKDYEAAIREFRAGYELDPHPAFLFAWAQAERLSGDCRSAIFAYERYLDTRPNAKQTTAANDAIARCRVALGPEPDRPQPTETHASVAPLPEAPAATVVPPQQPATPMSTPQRDDVQPAWYSDTLGGVLLGTGIASLAVGVGYYAASSSDWTASRKAATYGEYEQLVDRAESRGTTAWIGVGVGGALLTTAAFRYYSKRKSSSRSRDIAVGVTDGGAAVVFTASF